MNDLPPFHILLVDDSPADTHILQRALGKCSRGGRLTVLTSGAQTLHYLARLHQARCPAHLFPDLILLDLNLPGLDGTTVLERIKQDALLRALPVVVLTTSRRDEDILAAYRAGANSFIAKPDEFESYLTALQHICEYWGQVSLRPSRWLEPPMKEA